MFDILPFKAVYPQLDKIFLSDAFFENTKNLFPVFYQNGYYDTLEEEAIYIYQQYDGDRTFTGFISKTHVDNYLKGNILKHELTLAAKEEKQFRLLHERNGYVKPVLLTYPPVEVIEDILKEYTHTHKRWYSMHFRGVKNTFWKITNPKLINKLLTTFEKQVPKVYIADGHHRTATLAKYYHTQKGNSLNHNGTEPYNYLFTAYFASSELQVHDFSRVVQGLNGNSPLGFMSRLSNICEMKPMKRSFKPQKKGNIAMYLGGEWFSLKWHKHTIKKYKKKHPDKADRLDVAILNKKVLQGLLAVDDIRESTRIEYMEGNKGIGLFENRVNGFGGDGVGFVLQSLTLNDVMTISDEGGIMPPKSTFCLPRMYNGLMAYRFDLL